MCFSHILGNVASPNQIIWSGTGAYLPRRIHIWTQKFGIPPVAPTINRFVFQPHFRKCDLTKSDHLKWHQGLFSQENSYLNSEIWNSISGTFYGYICVSATLRDNLNPPNQIISSGMRSHFSRRIWIWSQKFQIQPVGSTVSIFLMNNI